MSDTRGWSDKRLIRQEVDQTVVDGTEVGQTPEVDKTEVDQTLRGWSDKRISQTWVGKTDVIRTPDIPMTYGHIHLNYYECFIRTRIKFHYKRDKKGLGRRSPAAFVKVKLHIILSCE